MFSIYLTCKKKMSLFSKGIFLVPSLCAKKPKLVESLNHIYSLQPMVLHMEQAGVLVPCRFPSSLEKEGGKKEACIRCSH